MTWLSDHWLQLAMLLIYLALLARHGMHGQRKSRSIDDYLVGGRAMGGVLISLSFYATFLSTNTFIGAAGKSWTVGLVWSVGGVVYIVLCCISWFVVAPRFVPLSKAYRSLTVADFLGTHYSSPALRQFAAGITAFASVVYLVAVYEGASLALASFLNLSYGFCAVAVFVIVTAYTLAGGFHSVVATDALQGLLMVAGAIGLPLAIVVQAGGIHEVFARMHERDPALLTWQGHMPMREIVALSLAVGIKFLVEPRMLSRFYGLRDAAALRNGMIVTPILVTITFICLLPIGAIAHSVLTPDAALRADGSLDTDLVVPHLLGTVNVFGPVLSILFLLVLLSAAMSSIDSVLLVAASTIERDLVGSPPDEWHALRRTRNWVVVVSLASLIGALLPWTDDIVTVTAFSGSFYGACFFPALVMGLFRRRRDWRGAMFSMICGSISVLVWFIAKQWKLVQLHEIWVGMAVGIGALLLVDVLFPEPTKPIESA